jgi:hypothetical protein
MAEVRFRGRDDPSTPSWLNPNIFFQSSPDDISPAFPLVNEPIFLFASVSNTGTQDTLSALVAFYVCNPATGPARETSHLVGTSNVVLSAGQIKEVLCVSPWLPSWVNGGHVCVICEITAQNDPSPNQSGIFDLADRHLAQHNVNILPRSSTLKASTIFNFGAVGFPNIGTTQLVARPAPKEAFASFMKRANLGSIITTNITDQVRAGILTNYRCGDPTPDVSDLQGTIKLELKPQQMRPLSLSVALPEGVDDSSAAMVFVEQLDGKGNVLGGVAVIALAGNLPKIPRIEVQRAIPASVPFRPYGTVPGTGFMTPDGLFTTILGKQDVNIETRNDGTGAFEPTTSYIEGFSDANIAVPLFQRGVASVQPSASFKSVFPADFKRATPGETTISFILQQGQGTSAKTVRILKKIFVVGVSLDPVSKTITIQAPQGTCALVVKTAVVPDKAPCSCDDKKRPPPFPGFIKTGIKTMIPNPAYAGPHGDLPFKDPWWKALIAVAWFALWALIAQAVDNDAESEIAISEPDTFGDRDKDDRCSGCEVQASTSNFWAGVCYTVGVAGAVVACFFDDADLFQRGQELTAPAAGELTVAEQVEFGVKFGESPATGRLFKGSVDWTYRRTTDSGRTIEASKSEEWSNIHVLKDYTVTLSASQISPGMYMQDRRKEMEVTAAFIRTDGSLCRGSDLYVVAQFWKQGQHIMVELRDDGSYGGAPNSGKYVGVVNFAKQELSTGNWYGYVIAQDVNTVLEGTEQREAAKTIGGIMVTKQLTIGLNGQPCVLEHDVVVTVV